MRSTLRFVIFAAIVVGCSSGSSPDGGVDASSDSDAAACPTYSGSNAVCKALVARCAACGSTGLAVSACDRAHFAEECEALSARGSALAQAMTTSCATVCDEDANVACQRAIAADATPTATLVKFGNDWCAACNDLDAGDACASGIASQFSTYSDEVIGATDSKCIDAGSCVDVPACMMAVLAEAGAIQCVGDAY